MKRQVMLWTIVGWGVLGVGACRKPDPPRLPQSTVAVAAELEPASASAAPAGSQEESLSPLAQKTADWYHNAEYITLQVDVAEERWWGEQKLANADVVWARGGRMRFDLKKPDGTPIVLIVCDGETVWEWDPRRSLYTEYPKPIFSGTDDVRLPCGGFDFCRVGILLSSWAGPTADIEAWIGGQIAAARTAGAPDPGYGDDLLKRQDEALRWQELMETAQTTGTVVTDGYPCNRITIQRNQRVDIVDVDQRSAVIRKMTTLQPGFHARVKTFHNIERPADVPREVFQFEAPPNARKLDFTFVPSKGWVQQ